MTESFIKLKEILAQKIPETALNYCLELWQEVPFSFVLSKSRYSCFGNYVFRNGKHKITINHDLNSYAFLLTYIHEIAHQRAWLGSHKIQPHGKEWKQAFQKLMNPVLNETAFPVEILVPLKLYMANPAASSVSFLPLANALKMFDKTIENNGISLAEIPDNQHFKFRERVFTKLEKRRTRVLCLEKKSQKRYTILASAKVELIEK